VAFAQEAEASAPPVRRKMVSPPERITARLWHVANALFVAPDSRSLTFMTLDNSQKEMAARLGFAT
jgi:hypothetical protein